MDTEEMEIGGPCLEHASYGLPPILQKHAVAGFEVVKFLPLQIDYEDQVEAMHTMLKRHGKTAGGFNEDKPVPSLWYADIEALREGMWKRIKSVEERIEKRVLHRTRGIMSAGIAARCGLEPDDESRIEDLPVEEQARLVHFYRMVADGTPWPLIERFGSTLMPNMMHIIRFFVRMPQDKNDAKYALIDCRDGLLTIMRPYLLQWNAATIALNSISLQVPIYDLPNLIGDPFTGREKALKAMPDYVVHNIEAVVEAYRKDARSVPTDVGTFAETWIPNAGATHGKQRQVGGRSAYNRITKALRRQGYSVENGDWRRSNPESLCELLERLVSEKYRVE